MLNILHSKINNIAPIISIEEINNSIHIQYENEEEVTDNQRYQINEILNQWPLELAKLEKIKILDNTWNNNIKIGWLTPYGWKLGLDTTDVSLLTGAFLLAKEASTLGLSQEASIIDTDGVSHNISISNFTSLLIQYGQYRSSLSAEYANTKTQIEQCQSLEELNNII